VPAPDEGPPVTAPLPALPPWCPPDTTPEAHAVQTGIYRRMGGARRLSVAMQLSDAVRRVTVAGIRSRHPQYSEAQVRLAWCRVTLGDALVRAAWPDEALVDP
jgi:hypothetical protein